MTMDNIVNNDTIEESRHSAKKELEDIFVNLGMKGKPLTLAEHIKSKMRNEKLVIYGGGQMGHLVLDVIQSIPVTYFLDQRANILNFVNGIKVVYPDKFSICDDDRESTLVIVAIVFEKKAQKDEVYKLLYALGYKNIMNFAEIWFYYGYRSNINSSQSEHDFYSHVKEDVLNVLDFLADKSSIEVYKNFIKASIIHQADYYIDPDDRVPTYFVDDIPFCKGYSNFIECGALDGNTIATLVEKKGKIKKLAIFEPDAVNFQTTLHYIKNNVEQIAEEVYLYPCGVWSGEKRLSFNENCKGASQISSLGTSIIQCAAIDDVLLNFAPTFLKMDVEGAEYEALLGAKQTILRYKPDMAICIYHVFEHAWEIIKLLNNWNVGYKYYIKSHGCFGFGATLYAVTTEV